MSTPILTTSVIEVTDVAKRYRHVDLFHDVTFSIEPGLTYGLIGPNGSGKSVLLKLLAGLALPDHGTVVIDPAYLSRDRSYPDRFGVTLNAPAYLGNLSGRKNLLQLAAIRNRVSEEQVDETLESVGLDGTITQKVRNYSLGMKQKLAIAQALMERPEVLILDEPFNALDRTSAARVRALLVEQQNRGTTIVFTSHDRRDIDGLSNHVLEIDDMSVRLRP